MDVAAFGKDLLEQLEAMPRLLAAAILSALVGWERETRNRPAGLRTHIVMGISAALLMVVGELVAGQYHDLSSARIDGLRLLEALAAGAAFIGAGTIIKGGEGVEGLTTAATLFATALIGATCGLGKYGLAVGAVVLVIFVARVLSWLPIEQKKDAES